MDLKTLRAELQKLAALAEGWDASHEIADIERDLALGKLRELYDAVRFGLDSAVQPSVEDELSPVDLPPVEIDLDAVIPLTAMSEPFGADPAAVPLEEPTIAPPVVESPVAGPSEAPFAAAPAVEPVGTPAEVSAEMPAETAVPAEIPLQAPAEAPVEERTEIPAEAVEGTVGAPVVEPTVDPIGEIPAEAVATVSEPSAATDSEGAPVVAEAPAVVAEPLSLFELDPVDVKRAKHRVVLSLYGDTDSVTPAPGKVEPAAEERPVPPPQAVPAVSPSSADVPQEEPAATSVPVGGVGHRAVAAGNGAAVLGETLNSDVKTVSDLIAVTTPPAAVGQEPVADLLKHDVSVGIDAGMLSVGCETGKYFIDIRQVEVSAEQQVLCPPVVPAKERVDIRKTTFTGSRIPQVAHIGFPGKRQITLRIVGIVQLFGGQILEMTLDGREYLRNRPRTQSPLSKHIFFAGFGLLFHASQTRSLLSAVVLFLHHQIEFVQTVHPRTILLLVVAQRFEQTYHDDTTFMFQLFHLYCV